MFAQVQLCFFTVFLTLNLLLRSHIWVEVRPFLALFSANLLLFISSLGWIQMQKT